MAHEQMPTIPIAFFNVTEDNELYLQWRNGDRHLTVYLNPPDSEDGPLDCFGSAGASIPVVDFESVYEGYRWLVADDPTRTD